jgi:nucleoside-diphosphate-sugar epimerase
MHGRDLKGTSANPTASRPWIVDASDTVLVTGANGFVGSRVVEVLLEYGFTRIRCFVRSAKRLPRLRDLGASAGADVEFLQGNLLSRDDCRAAVRDASLIVHLAAGTGKSFAGCFLDSVVATRNLLDAALAENRLKRFLNVSSLSVHSGFRMRKGDTLSEASPIEKNHMARFDPYCYGKIKQDQLVVSYGKEKGLPYVILRPGLVYGPGKRAIPGRVGIDTFGVFLRLGGSNRLPLIFVDNCAEAIVAAAIVDGVNQNVLIALDDELPTSRSFLRGYKRAVGRFLSIPVPYGVFYAFCRLWEAYARWSEGQLPPAFNRRNCATYYQKQRYTNLKLKEKTGWRPRIPYAEASRRYFQFMKSGVTR